MKHIEPIKNLPYNSEYSTGTYWTDNLPPSMSELVVKINEIVEVLNSLTEKKLPLMVKDVPQSSIEKAKNCIRRNKELDEEENNLPVECECSDLKSGSVIKLNNDRKCVSCGKDYSFEPEKTAESDWESKVREIWMRTNTTDDYINLIKNLLTSHTEQKKKELIEKALFEVETVPEQRGLIDKEEVIDLIKEL